MILVLLGPPACGKGTQARNIARHLGGTHISTGFLLREAVEQRKPLGMLAQRYVDAGELVPDDLVISLVREVLQCGDNSGPAVLDGFPRTVSQAQALDAFLPPDRVILIELDNTEVILRISGRRMGPNGESYHVLYNPPPQGLVAVQRSDDREDVVRERLEIYHRQTEPMLEFYERKGLLCRVSGKGSIEEVFDSILPLLG